MIDKGFIVLHRKLVNWEWYTDLPTKTLFIHLLLTANWEENAFQGVVIPPGSRVCSQPNLAAETGLSVMQIRTALDKLKRTGEITVTQHPKFSIISIVSWLKYQSQQQSDNSPITVKQQSGNSQITPIKQYNNITKKQYNNYGEYKNVRLTDEELAKWKTECPRWSEYIEKLSEYIASSGKKYKSHLATLRSWYRKDKEQSPKGEKESRKTSYDLGDFESKAFSGSLHYEPKI